MREVLQNAVGAVSLALIAVILVLGTRPPPSPAAAQQALTGSADAQVDAEPVLRAPEAVLVVTGRDDVAGRLGQGLDAQVALHRSQGFATGPGLFTSLPADLEGRRPQAVVLQGGEADVRDPDRAGRAVEQMVDRVRATAPEAPVVVVGPLAADPASAPPALRAVRDALAASARAKDAAFLDPLALDPATGTDVIDQLAGEVAALLDVPVGAE